MQLNFLSNAVSVVNCRKKVMKAIGKYIIPLLLFTGLTSCTDSTGDTPDTNPDSVTFKADGVQKIFTNVQVTEGVFIEGELSVPTYNVLATNEEDNGEFIALQVQQDYSGTEGLYEFIYSDTNGETHSIADNFNFNVTTGTTEQLAGTFSGPLFDASPGITPSVVITEGVFDINF